MSPPPQTLTVTQCHALREAMLTKSGTSKQFRKGVRNHTICTLLLETGIRVGELVNLRWDNLFFNFQPVLSIIIPAGIAKNNLEREIPTSTLLCETLITYYQYFRTPHCQHGNGYAFYRSDIVRQLTTRTVQRVIGSAAKKALGRSVHPHVLRHTFATRLLKVTDLRTVQILLGHKSVTSTQVYTHPGQDDLKAAIETASKNNNQTVSNPVNKPVNSL